MSQVPSSAPPLLVRLVLRLESARVLDTPAGVVRPLVARLLADPRRANLLRGTAVGHAVHPTLTDVPIGAWTSATVLDLVGGERSRPAAQRLLAVGLVAAVPTAVTGWAEWGGASRRDQRVGVVHAVSNAVAVWLYAWSWAARRHDRHRRGVALALAGGGAAAAGGYLGGHLTEARKVSSRHPAFSDAARPQPQL